MPNPKVTLTCTLDQYHALSLAADTKRGTLTKVDAGALRALLLDHGRLIKYAKDQEAVEGYL